MKAMQGLQQDFQQAVLARSSANDLITPVQTIQANVGGFNIYANAYRVRLAAALADNYPILRLALGDEMFDALTSAYVEQHPSTYRSIRWYGDQLAMFMEAHSTLMPHPALADLARMDWALRLSSTRRMMIDWWCRTSRNYLPTLGKRSASPCARR